MTPIGIALVLVTALAGSCALTALMRQLALRAQMLDLPNERSSHSQPTPRGGGVAIVLSFMVLMTATLLLSGAIPTPFAVALLGGGVIIAVIGFIDDRAHLSAGIRFCAHLAAAALTVWSMHGVPPLPLFGFSIDLHWMGPVLTVIYLVWMVNLYNFMDGIDGIASIEAIVACSGGALAWWIAAGSPLWFIPVMFAACVGGFLIWNYPPAKIFMGDAGSGFIGFILGVFSLWSARQTPQVFWCWIILLGGFIVDATVTLVRRVKRGDKFHEAHRNHAYQYASRKYASHKRVTLAFGAISSLWLLPISLLVATNALDGAWGTAVAYTPLIWLAFRYKAGARTLQEI